MHPKKVIAERAHKWEPRGKRMNRTSRRKKYQHLLPYKVVAVLPARSPLSVNRGRHQQPCSFFFLVSLDRPRGTLQLRHTQRRRLIHETLQNGYEAHSRSNSFFSPFSPQRMHRIYFTITLRKLLSNTHFDDIRTQVTRFFPCSNLTEKNHVVTRSTSTITENIDTCDLFIYVKSRENRYWSRTDACVPIVTLCCTEKRKNCRLQHWRADEISCTDRCDTRYAHIQLSRAADSGRLSVEKVLRLAYAIAALLAADTWPIASRVFGRSLCAPIP